MGRPFVGEVLRHLWAVGKESSLGKNFQGRVTQLARCPARPFSMSLSAVLVVQTPTSTRPQWMASTNEGLPLLNGRRAKLLIWPGPSRLRMVDAMPISSAVMDRTTGVASPRVHSRMHLAKRGWMWTGLVALSQRKA